MRLFNTSSPTAAPTSSGGDEQVGITVTLLAISWDNSKQMQNVFDKVRDNCVFNMAIGGTPIKTRLVKYKMFRICYLCGV
jgi:hypothetical protein